MRAILDAGLSLAALRDSLYADVAPLLAYDGVIRGPAADGRVASVAREDVARLAAAVLVDDAHADRVYDRAPPQRRRTGQPYRSRAVDPGETAAVHPGIGPATPTD